MYRKLVTDNPEGNYQLLHNMTFIKDKEVYLKLGDEGINSVDKLSGVVNITYRQSFCNLRGEPILINENVEDYNSKCPLKGQGMYFEDKS